MVAPRRRVATGAAILVLSVVAVGLASAPVVAHGLDSGNIAPGENWTMTFYIPQEFAYHCHPHPWMEGSLTVLPAEAGGNATEHVVRIVEPRTNTDSWGYEPAHLEIHAGDRVVWVNEGGSAHTVTQEDGHEQGHGAVVHDEDDHAEAPVGPLVLVLAAIAAVAVAIRRRAPDA